LVLDAEFTLLRFLLDWRWRSILLWLQNKTSSKTKQTNQECKLNQQTKSIKTTISSYSRKIVRKIDLQKLIKQRLNRIEWHTERLMERTL
jgi:hypothetical protein